MPTRTSPSKVAATADRTLRELGLTIEPAADRTTDRIVTHPSGSAVRVRPAAGRGDGPVIEFSTRIRGGHVPAVDYWLVWHPDSDRVFAVPDSVCGRATVYLRVEPALNRVAATINPADAYDIELHRDAIVGRGLWPQPAETSVNDSLRSTLARCGPRHVSGQATRDETVELQRAVVAATEAVPAQVVAEQGGMRVHHVRSLLSAASAGRVAGFDRSAGRRSKAELRRIAQGLLGHPAAAPFVGLVEDDPSWFLFEVAIAATDGSGGQVRRFLERHGWSGVSKGTVHRRIRQWHERQPAAA